MLIRLGLPYLPSEHGHPFLAAARDLDAKILISVGSLYRPDRGWLRAPVTAWTTSPALDSAGFTAMVKFGGYRWTVEEYVEKIVTNFARDDMRDDGLDRCVMPHPWAWWSPMDYCCEEDIAPNRAEVEHRIGMTVDSYVETLEALQSWRDEGENTTPDPLPILQGRTPADYVRCARALESAIDAHNPCICPTLSPADIEAIANDERADCPATWHRDTSGLPELVGVGSVCTREATGPEGVLGVLDALDRELPKHVKCHLFGVKGDLLEHPAFASYLHRVASVDSSAWDDASRHAAQATRKKTGQDFSNDLTHKTAHLRRWFKAQRITGQVPLFGRGAE
jgi:hypothetical protein